MWKSANFGLATDPFWDRSVDGWMDGWLNLTGCFWRAWLIAFLVCGSMLPRNTVTGPGEGGRGSMAMPHQPPTVCLTTALEGWKLAASGKMISVLPYAQNH